MYPTSYKGEIVSSPGGAALSAVPLYSAPAAPTPTPVSKTVVTSNAARNDVAGANAYLDKQAASDAALAKARTMAKETQAQIDAQNAAKMEKDKTYETIASKGGIDLSNAKTRASDYATAAEARAAAYKANVKKIQRQLDSLQANMDARTSATIENIKQQYDSLVKEQEQANLAFQGGVTTAGFVSGRARYAPEIQTGLVTQAINQGIGKISDLQQKRAQLINEAEAARDERNYKLLTTKMDLLRQNYKDEQSLAQQMLENTRAAEREQREETEFNGKLYASQISKALEGLTPAQQETALPLLAERYGLSQDQVLSYSTSYQEQQQKDLPSAIREYEYAKSSGMIPKTMTFLGYQNYGKDTTPSTKNQVTIQQANALGLKALAGVDKTSLINSLTDDYGKIVTTAPSWFVKMSKETNAKASDEQIQKAWEAHVANNEDNITSFVSGFELTPSI